LGAASDGNLPDGVEVFEVDGETFILYDEGNKLYQVCPCEFDSCEEFIDPTPVPNPDPTNKPKPEPTETLSPVPTATIEPKKTEKPKCNSGNTSELILIDGIWVECDPGASGTQNQADD
jgi:hypothetical protein